jgi:hypothetical protein
VDGFGGKFHRATKVPLGAGTRQQASSFVFKVTSAFTALVAEQIIAFFPLVKKLFIQSNYQMRLLGREDAPVLNTIASAEQPAVFKASILAF